MENTDYYTCPMHPDIKQEMSGRCPKCGMALVLASTVKAKPSMHQGDAMGLGKITWKSYMPLIVIFTLLVLSSIAVSLHDYVQGTYLFSNAVSYFMAGFFLVFAGFKLLDLKGFAEGYSTYDLLAQKWFGYGYVYPFLELGFGLIMLAGIRSPQLLWVELVVMLFSGLGVAIKLARKEEFTCACLGTFLKVPLTYVTLLEDFGMAALAALMLFLL